MSYQLPPSLTAAVVGKITNLIESNILNFQIAQFVSMMMIFKVVMLHRIHQQQHQKRHQYNNNNAVVVAPTTKY